METDNTGEESTQTARDSESKSISYMVEEVFILWKTNVTAAWAMAVARDETRERTFHLAKHCQPRRRIHGAKRHQLLAA
jgi:hypothetical protein